MEIPTLEEIENDIRPISDRIDSFFSGYIYGTVSQAEFFDKKEDILNFMKLFYRYNTQVIKADNFEKDFYSWSSEYIKVWIIWIASEYSDRKRPFFFSTSSESNEIEIINAHNQTRNLKFFSLKNSRDIISYLFHENVIPDVSKSIIGSSLSFLSKSPTAWIDRWVLNEENNALDLINSPFELLDFNELKIRAKRYNFENMLQILDNVQFSMEFDECLFAYNNQKWFICASGLGGILEHLLYLVLKKNNLIGKNFPASPTASHYIEYLRKPPIDLNSRQEAYIKTLFMTRNSISHYNQGFTSKDQCTMLMNGIKDVFDNYYVKDFGISDR